jgi:hypothetical protein
VANRRPRPGRKSQVTLDLQREAPQRLHPLGVHRPGSVGSADGPRHATTNDLWCVAAHALSSEPAELLLGQFNRGRVPERSARADRWRMMLLRRYTRWKKDQPDPSFDIDGDGTISSFDMAVAREFDKDGNGERARACHVSTATSAAITIAALLWLCR